MATLRKSAPRKNHKASKPALEPTPRHVWLASLGLLVAARREGKAAAGRAAAKAGTAAASVRQAVKQAEAGLRDGLHDVRGQVQPTVVKFSHEVESRLAPVLDKLGLKKQAKRRGRKPAAKKTVARRTTRKPAKRAVRKAAR